MKREGGLEKKNRRLVVKVVCPWCLFKRSKMHEEEKKSGGGETGLIKVVFKEADMLGD